PSLIVAGACDPSDLAPTDPLVDWDHIGGCHHRGAKSGSAGRRNSKVLTDVAPERRSREVVAGLEMVLPHPPAKAFLSDCPADIHGYARAVPGVDTWRRRDIAAGDVPRPLAGPCVHLAPERTAHDVLLHARRDVAGQCERAHKAHARAWRSARQSAETRDGDGHPPADARRRARATL